MRAVITIFLLTLVACGGSGSEENVGDNFIDDPPLWNEYVIGYAETINLAVGVPADRIEHDPRGVV